MGVGAVHQHMGVGGVEFVGEPNPSLQELLRQVDARELLPCQIEEAAGENRPRLHARGRLSEPAVTGPDHVGADRRRARTDRAGEGLVVTPRPSQAGVKDDQAANGLRDT
jgi:hypothetical protein